MNLQPTFKVMYKPFHIHYKFNLPFINLVYEGQYVFLNIILDIFSGMIKLALYHMHSNHIHFSHQTDKKSVVFCIAVAAHFFHHFIFSTIICSDLHGFRNSITSSIRNKHMITTQIYCMLL